MPGHPTGPGRSPELITCPPPGLIWTHQTCAWGVVGVWRRWGCSRLPGCTAVAGCPERPTGACPVGWGGVDNHTWVCDCSSIWQPIASWHRTQDALLRFGEGRAKCQAGIGAITRLARPRTHCTRATVKGVQQPLRTSNRGPADVCQPYGWSGMPSLPLQVHRCAGRASRRAGRCQSGGW